MIQALHSFLQFIWHNLIGICIWIWIASIAINMIDTSKRLDIIEKNNGLIIDWIKEYQKAIQGSKPIQPSDTIPPIPHSEIWMDGI